MEIGNKLQKILRIDRGSRRLCGCSWRYSIILSFSSIHSSNIRMLIYELSNDIMQMEIQEEIT